MADVASGLEGLDLGALSPEQQAQLMEFKINTRIANEKYLRSHKEVELLLSGFLREQFAGSRYPQASILTPHCMQLTWQDFILENQNHREVMLRRPENIHEFAAEHFTDPELPMKIQKKLAEKANQMN